MRSMQLRVLRGGHDELSFRLSVYTCVSNKQFYSQIPMPHVYALLGLASRSKGT